MGLKKYYLISYRVRVLIYRGYVVDNPKRWNVNLVIKGRSKPKEAQVSCTNKYSISKVYQNLRVQKFFLGRSLWLIGYDCTLTFGHHRQQSPTPANEKGLPASLLRRHSEQITSMLRDKALSGHITSLDLGYAPLEPPSLLSKPPLHYHTPLLLSPRNHRLHIKYFLFVHQYLIIWPKVFIQLVIILI